MQLAQRPDSISWLWTCFLKVQRIFLYREISVSQSKLSSCLANNCSKEFDTFIQGTFSTETSNRTTCLWEETTSSTSCSLWTWASPKGTWRTVVSFLLRQTHSLQRRKITDRDSPLCFDFNSHGYRTISPWRCGINWLCFDVLFERNSPMAKHEGIHNQTKIQADNGEEAIDPFGLSV